MAGMAIVRTGRTSIHNSLMRGCTGGIAGLHRLRHAWRTYCMCLRVLEPCASMHCPITSGVSPEMRIQILAFSLILMIGCGGDKPEEVQRRPISEHEFAVLELVTTQDARGYFMAHLRAWARAPGDECAVTKDAWARVEPGTEFEAVSLGEDIPPKHSCALGFEVERFLGAGIEGGAEEQILSLGGSTGAVAGMRGVGVVGRRSFEAVLGPADEEPSLTLLWSHEDSVLPSLRVSVKDNGEGFTVTGGISQEGRAVRVPLPRQVDSSALVSAMGSATIPLSECFGASQCTAETRFTISKVPVRGD